MKQTTKNPPYSWLENIVWMFEQAWSDAKSVPFLCLLIALASLALNLIQLFIGPQILSKVEQGASLGSLFLTIGFFTGALFLSTGLKNYLEEISLFGRISVRTSIVLQITKKTNLTSYPNMLDSQVAKVRAKAMEATAGNNRASEHIWTTLTSLMTNLLGFATYLFMLSHLSGLLLIVVVVTSLCSFFLSRRTDSWRYRHRDREADYLKKLGYIRNKSQSQALAKDIRIFGLDAWLKDVYQSILKLYEGFLKENQKYKLLGHLADVALSILRNGIAYYYLVHLTLSLQLPASRFLLYFTALSGFTNWILGILKDCATLHTESLDLSTIREYLDLAEPFRFQSGQALPDLSQGACLCLENVSYAYPDTDRQILHKINLTLHPGEKLALVGLNGAGKTTLVKLMCGLLDPSQGAVTLNGIDIRDFNRQDYYQAFSTVFQDFSLLDISIAENVAQSVDKVDQDRIWDCLVLAGLEKKIKGLAEGIDTKLGRKIWEEGTEFSGGQIQKLLLARALYRQAPILLLDEPTAALDPLAENDIYLKYKEMTQGKSSVFVSHRLATTRFCDRILFLKDGQILEEGSHDQLLAKGGEYAKLYDVQSRYYQEGRDF